MSNKLKQRVVDFLDQPSRRRFLAPLATAYASAQNHKLVGVRDIDGLWVHNHGAGKLVFRGIYTISPERLESITVDTFFHSYTPKRDDITIDIGAGVGTEILTFSRLVGDGGRVIAVEAHPETYRCLETMCGLNELHNVSTRQIAIMESSGPVFISDSDSDISNSVIGDTSRTISVPGLSLDELVAKENLPRIDFLKMNIEGAEAPALRGMQRTLELARHLAISCHDFIADRSGDESMRTKAVVRATLEDHDFEVEERENDSRPWVRDTLYATKRIP